MNEPVKIWIPGRGVGKARAIVANRRAFLPRGYRDWKSSAVEAIEGAKLPKYAVPVRVECFFVNFFSSDCDNLVGAVIDALKDAGVIHNDSSGYVTEVEGRFCKTRKKRGVDKPVGILVAITRREIEVIGYEDFEQLLGGVP